MRAKNVMKKLLILGLLVFPLVSVVAEPPRSWNHDTNPALLSVRNRRLIEIGVSPEVGVGNSYFSIGDILQENVVLNLTTMSEELGERDLRFANTISAESHLVASLFGVTGGWYANVDGVVSGGIPSSLFSLLTEGNELGQELSGSSKLVGRVFADMGVYAGLRWKKDWYFGMKFGAFAPILYTDPEPGASEIGFTFSTDPATGQTSIDAGLNMTAYSAVNFDDVRIESPADAFAYFSGRKVDLGAIYADGRTPLYGFNLSGITIKPAIADTMMTMNATASVTIDNPLGNYEDTEAMLVQELGDPEFEFVTGVGRPVRVPLQLGGFYRLTTLPIIDVIGHGQLYIANPFQLTAGAIVEGSFFPLNLFSFGVEYDRVAWKTTAGLRLNLWLAELGVDVGLTSPRLLKLFSSSGVSAKIYFAMGL